MIDSFSRLCGTGQAITVTGHLSSGWEDLGVMPSGSANAGAFTKRGHGGGKPVVMKIGCSVAAVCAADPDCIVTISLVTVPLIGAAVDTARTLAAFNNTTEVDDTTEIITSTAHGLSNGTRVTLANTSGTMNTNLVAATSYWVRDATTNTFRLAATPGGAAINVTDQVGTTTATWYPEILFSVPIPLQALLVGYQREIAIPPQSPTNGATTHRYLRAFFEVTTTITAGTVTVDLVDGYSMNGKPYHAVNYLTAGTQ